MQELSETRQEDEFHGALVVRPVKLTMQREETARETLNRIRVQEAQAVQRRKFAKSVMSRRHFVGE